MQRRREVFVLGRGPRNTCEELLEPLTPAGCVAVQLQPVVPDVDELGDADDALRV